MPSEFVHRQCAHCESGVTTGLIAHAGVPITEPLAFGIGAGLFFAYFPFFKMDRIPLTTFRVAPGLIFRRAAKQLGVGVGVERFKDQNEAMDALDRRLDAGQPVGLQVGIYWLPFMPEALRFHFNAHNLIVFGKENGEYQISDPVLDRTVLCSARALRKARFARGALAPRGKMYWVETTPERPPFERAIASGIRAVTFSMLYFPPPFLGVAGIRFIASRLRRWPERLGDEMAALHLGQVVRMQEEIGTGGAGFRYLYAAFLQEAAELTGDKQLDALSSETTAVGDLWSEFAVRSARLCKGRPDAGDSYETLARLLENCAKQEKELYKKLRKTLSVRPTKG